LLLALVPAAAGAGVPFTWSVPAGGETWTTGHVHTILWSGGPASPVNIYLIGPGNVVAQVITTGAVNDGEYVFRLAAGLTPGTYQIYIEDNTPTEWTYGPSFTIQTSGSLECDSRCTSGGTGAPALVCGQTQAQAEALAIALVQSYVACGMAGNVDPGSVEIETTLLAVGAFNCPPGYSGAYAVEASGLWCCCPEPVSDQPQPWSHVKSLYRD
jgi:hypothetical protein